MKNKQCMKEKVHLVELFKHWILDCQFKIQSEKTVIRDMLALDFKEEYRSILTKALKYCNAMAKEDRDIDLYEFKDDLLEMDILPYYESHGLNLGNMPVRAMDQETEEELKRKVNIFGFV